MIKNLLILILLSFIMISASVQSQPNLPKQTIVQSFHEMYNIQDDITNYIKTNSKKGYIVKSVAISEYESWQRGVVVMEKY